MSVLGGDALGRLALGQIQQAGPTTTVLTADPGAFVFTGVAATFTIKEAAAAGAFAFTGVSATFRVTEATTAGAFAFTGRAATFRIYETALSGSFVFTGYPALEPLTENCEPGHFVFTGYDAPLTRTGAEFDLTYGGIGHLLYERERAKQLAAITRNPPPPIDTRTVPQFNKPRPLPAPPVAPIAPVVDMAAVQSQRMAAQAAAVQATKKRREIEAILLLAS